MAWTCFLIERTDRVRRWLRRYSGPQAGLGWTCAEGYHQALTQIEDGPLVIAPEGYHSTEPAEWPCADPRWPTHCACGYAFHAEHDPWQLHYQALFQRPETGDEYVLRPESLPIGAMFDCPWFLPQWAGPDGRCLQVMTPGGLWVIDGPSSSGGRWQRTGTPPLITARPSILAPRYHGWLTDGVLTDDLDGRSYPPAGGA